MMDLRSPGIGLPVNHTDGSDWAATPRPCGSIPQCVTNPIWGIRKQAVYLSSGTAVILPMGGIRCITGAGGNMMNSMQIIGWMLSAVFGAISGGILYGSIEEYSVYRSTHSLLRIIFGILVFVIPVTLIIIVDVC